MPRKRSSEPDMALSSGAAPVRRKVAARPRTQRPAVGQADAQTVTAVPVALAVTSVEPSFEDISRLAYSYWEARGFQGGSPEEDWLRAERELGKTVLA
jgi:hypothetical protein